MNLHNLVVLATLAVLMVPTGAALTSAHQTTDYWHTNDYYSVEMDGEGEAFVVARMKLQGVSEGTQSDITLEIPSRSATVYKVAQESGRYTSNAYFLDYSLERLGDSTRIKISLEEPIKADETTEILLVYKQQGVAEKSLGTWNFRFESVKDNSALVRKAGVEISAPDRMHMQGTGDSDVDYKPSLTVQQAMEGSMAANEMFRRAPRRHNPDHTVRNLDPGESMTVTGGYSESWVLLHLDSLIGGAVILLLFLLISNRFSPLRSLRKWLRNTPKRKRGTSAAPVAVTSIYSTGLFLTSLAFARFTMKIMNGLHGETALVLGFGLLLLDVILVLGSLFVPSYIIYRGHGFRAGISGFIGTVILSLSVLTLYATTQTEPVRMVAEAAQMVG